MEDSWILMSASAFSLLQFLVLMNEVYEENLLHILTHI